MANVRDFGAAGDGRTDDAAALEHAIRDGDGALEFPRGEYRMTRPLVVPLAEIGPVSITGAGGAARLRMEGAGPALHFVGTHDKSADPAGFAPGIWQRERLPLIAGIEIVGAHPQADGIRLEGVMQPTLTAVAIREVRTALHVTQRCRNLLVSQCHFFHNRGVGVHLDGVNLHQTIIAASHISYCRLGGIRIERSEIRNLQITGNDIEYNNHRSHGAAEPEPTAEIYIDVREGTVREGTICSNTLQATASPGGANIRCVGPAEENHRVGMWTISGNLIGSQEVNVHLTGVRGVTLAGNYIYSGHLRNLLVENSRNIVVGANCFGHNPDYHERELATGLRFVDCEGVVLNGVLLEDALAGRHTVEGAAPIERDALLELIRCRRVNVAGTQILACGPYGMLLEDCRDTVISGCTVLHERADQPMRGAICWRGPAPGSLITGCRLGKGREGALLLPEEQPPATAALQQDE